MTSVAIERRIAPGAHAPEDLPMKRYVLPAAMWLGILLPASALAVECVNGVVRAGCVGPNGAASVNKQTGATHSTSTGQVKCADGVYRTACTGPNGGAAVIRRP
jgi:hypothetical protein